MTSLTPFSFGGLTSGGAKSPLPIPPRLQRPTGLKTPTKNVEFEEESKEESKQSRTTPTPNSKHTRSPSSTASGAFGSLAHSYSQLLDCLESPHEHNVTPEEMGDLLRYLTPQFLTLTATTFPPPSTPSTKILQSGSIQSSFPNEAGVYETQTLHEDWKKIVGEFATAMQLDAVRAYHILETYLHLYHYNNLSHFFTSPSTTASTTTASGTDQSSTLNLSELIHFYYTERCSLLECIATLFRIYLDDSHLYHEVAVTTVLTWSKSGLEKEIIARYKYTCAVQMPKSSPSTAVSTDANATAQSNLFADDPLLATNFADQNIDEQALLMEIMFLYYYENDAFTTETPMLEDTTNPSSTSGQQTESQTRFIQIYSLLHAQQFGRVQPLYPFLSARGRSTVDWIGQISILIGLELMSFEKLLRVYNHPIQEIKDVILRSAEIGNAGGDADEVMEVWESNKDAAILVLQESELTFREHPFHDLKFLAKVDSMFFEQNWNPKTQLTQMGTNGAIMSSFYAPLNLAWAVALSHVYEYLEDVQTIKFEFGLLGEDPETGRPIMDVAEYSAEKQIIILRLEASLAGGCNPFQLLSTILTRIQGLTARSGSVSGYALEHAVCNLPAFKEIVHELLTALFQSSCYSALLALDSHQTLTPILPLFNRIFHDDSALAYRFWSTDEKHPEDRPPIFDQAIERFPIEIAPFIDLLIALAGQTVTPVLRFTSAGDALDTRLLSDSTLADSSVCANRVFDTLLNMKFITTAIPPDHYLMHMQPQQIHAPSEYTIALNQSWKTPDGLLLPASTVGRFVQGDVNAEPRFIQWWLSYSAWQILFARIETMWKSMRGEAQTLTAKEWLELITIVQLISKLTRADPTIYAQLTTHLVLDSPNSNDTTLAMYNPNASQSSIAQSAIYVQQREIRLLVLLMRIQAFVSLHTANIIAAVNQTPIQQPNESQYMDASMGDTSQLLPSAASSTVQLTSPHLLALLDATSSILLVASKHDWNGWMKAFTLVMGTEMSTPSSGLQVNIMSANLLSSVSVLNPANSPYQSTYNYLHLLQRSFVNIQAPLVRYPLLITLLEQVSTVLLPLYQLATIQNLRAQDRSTAYAFLPPTANAQSRTVEGRTSLPVNPTFSAFLQTFDLHHVLKYICESIFIQYDEWKFAVRSDRWSLGSQIIRLFLLILSNANAPIVMKKPTDSNGTVATPPSTAGTTSLHEISLQQYLYSLFLTQPSMLLALLRPLLFGLALLDRLNYDRHHDEEIILLQDLLIHTFLLLKKLMNLESQQATVAPATINGANTKIASFYSVLLESVSAANVPSSWNHVNRRRGGKFSTTPNSLLQAMTEYANYTRSVELQSLSIQTIRLLCISGGSSATNPQTTLANYFTPTALQSFRRTCLQLLTAHSTDISLKVQVLQLLATMFERQPAMAQRFAVSSFLQQLQRLEGKENEDGGDENDDDDSLFQVLKAYILAAEDTFLGDPQALLLIYRILAAIWQSSSSSGMGVGHFSALQQRLRKEVNGFWEKITHCLTADIPDTHMSTDTNDPSMAASSLTYLLSIKLLRNCVWTIINAELFQSLALQKPTTGTTSSSTVDPALESILLAYGSSSSTPHRYIQFLLAYCHSSEHVATHRSVLDQLQQYHLDLAVFTIQPSSEELDEGMIKTPTYNLELMTKIIQLDLDLVFERETDQQSQIQNSMTDVSTSLVIHDGRVGASSHRTRIEELILTLKKVNNSMLIADAELTLLQSWRNFVQICLQKQPTLLGIKPKSTLAFEYIVQLATLLNEENRFGDGTLMSAYLKNVASLLLAFLTAGLSDGSGGQVAGDLTSAILIYLSRSSSHRLSVLDADDKATGESVFRATNELLSKVATTLQSSLKAYVQPIASITTLDQQQNGIVPVMATPAPQLNATRFTPFDVTARISTGPLAARVHSTLTTALSSQRAPQAVQMNHHLIAIGYMQHLLTSTLMLIRWSNQLLMQQFTQRQNDLTGTKPTTNTVSPNPTVRRLNDQFSSPTGGVRSSLAPVLENQMSVTTTGKTLIFAIGDEYAQTCQTMMKVTAACLVDPLLADLSITMMPLLIQAIDIIQGATKLQQDAQKDQSIRYDQEPIDAALDQLRPLLPLLLRHYETMPVTQPAIALKLVQLFTIMAQYESGADLLIQHSIVLHISHHRIFNPTHKQYAVDIAPGSTGPYYPSFSPYTPSNTRDIWHQVWVLSIELLSTLIRSMTNKSKIAGSITLQSGTSASALSPTHGKLLDEVLGFFNLFSSTRLNQVLHLSHVYQLSIGSLDEIDALTHLIYEFESYGHLWHRVNPALFTTQRQQLLLIGTYYMRLLNDHRELEKRILVISPEEKADAKSIEEEEKENDGKAEVGLARHSSLFDEKPNLDRQKSETMGITPDEKKSLELVKKSTWRPLGASSGGIGSGSSTPGLSTPTTPRSSSTPLSQTPGLEEKSSDGPTPSRTGLNVNTILPPQRGTSSFLLRSPVVGSLVNRNIETADTSIGFGSISGASAAEAKHVAATTQKGFAFFTQRIEYSMCLILRNCLSYLRLHSRMVADTFSMREILFNHRIKVVNLSNATNMLTTSTVNHQLMLLSNGFHSGGSNHDSSRVGVTSREKIVQIFTGLGIGIEEEAHTGAADLEFESDYYNENGQILETMEQRLQQRSQEQVYVFRPPLSMLIDFMQYNVKVLTRIFEIQKSSGLLDSLDDRPQSQSGEDEDDSSLTVPTPFLPHTSQLISGALHSSYSPSAPSIPAIHSVMQFLLEHTLYIFTQHVQVHLRQLKKLQLEYLSQMTAALVPLNTAPTYYAYGQQQQQQPLDLPQPIVPPGAIRIGKLLDQYRERLGQIVDLLGRYIQLLSTSDTNSAPPTLINVHQPMTHLRVPRLVWHLKQVVEELMTDLNKHIATTRYLTRSTQVRTTEQQQQQMHQQQFHGPTITPMFTQ